MNPTYAIALTPVIWSLCKVLTIVLTTVIEVATMPEVIEYEVDEPEVVLWLM